PERRAVAAALRGGSPRAQSTGPDGGSALHGNRGDAARVRISVSSGVLDAATLRLTCWTGQQLGERHRAFTRWRHGRPGERAPRYDQPAARPAVSQVECG